MRTPRVNEQAMPAFRIDEPWSLYCGLALCAVNGGVGCLVTDTPQFSPPTLTAPYLVSLGADPDPEQVVVLDDQGHPALLAGETRKFSAFVTSQDDPSAQSAFSSVTPQLYVDYGTVSPDNPSQPYFAVFGGDPVPSNTLGQPLPVAVDFQPFDLGLPYGCHTLTLMVSHDFTTSAPICPEFCGDFSAMTWLTVYCDSTSADTANACHVVKTGGPTGCPLPEDACSATSGSTLRGESGPDAGAACTEPAAGVE
jgi:hypothetical protein